MNIYYAGMLAFYRVSYLLYLNFSHGLGHRAEFLQLRRFIPCAILPIIPCLLMQVPLSHPLFLASLFTGFLWMISYPGLYYATYHNVSKDFGFHLDFVFGMYLTGWLVSLKILVLHVSVLPTVLLSIVSVIELFWLLVPLAEFGYYHLYGRCVSEAGMLLILETNYNEIIEYFHSLPKKVLAAFVCLAAVLTGLLFYSNLSSVGIDFHPLAFALPVTTAIFIFFTVYLFVIKKNVFVRTGLVELYLDTREYFKSTLQYTENMQKRIADLQVIPLSPSCRKPSTFILVIGESESRDYMSAFREFEDNGVRYDTTPWLRSKKSDPHFILFPNTYSVMANTVQAVSRAVTEYNQYNNLEFYNACSIIDIARKLGFCTSWYSNQGHLGSADTPVTLVANTADTAKWTRQSLNTVQYDEALLEYLKEADPSQNNFIVLHLKGSHFNFINRYPESYTQWGTPGKYETRLNYYNSVYYTDCVLKQIYEYASSHLNLQAMLYFSDHGDKPDKHRSPDFDGFASLRIPMFLYFSDEYIQNNTAVYETLKAHRDYYFTNDLVYELLCGIFNIKSNHYDEACSLASPQFKFTQEMLRVNLGKTPLTKDITPEY